MHFSNVLKYLLMCQSGLCTPERQEKGIDGGLGRSQLRSMSCQEQQSGFLQQHSSQEQHHNLAITSSRPASWPQAAMATAPLQTAHWWQYTEQKRLIILTAMVSLMSSSSWKLDANFIFADPSGKLRLWQHDKQSRGQDGIEQCLNWQMWAV